MKSIHFILIILCFGNLLALMNAPQHIAAIPSGARFAGHEATAYHNGNLYFVYLKNQADPKLRDLIFVRSSDGGQTYSYQTIATSHDYGICGYDSLGHFTTNDQSAPTIFVNDEHIIITYHDFGKFYTAISSDNGTSFTINQFDSGYDPLPFVQEWDGQQKSFVASKDLCTDGLYSSFYRRFETENVDYSMEAGRTYFWGPDVVYGPVRSNTDIWVEQMGGGTNNGWPTFWGPVYTSGEIRSFSGVVPYETIFKGGVFEHVAPMELDVDTRLLDEGPVFPLSYAPNRICLVRVNFGGYRSWIGDVVENVNPYQLDVYSSYPPPIGPVVATNTITRKDTIWVEGPQGAVSNNSIHVKNPLLIEGTFGGKQTWYCDYDIKIIGNIKLNGTPLGANPDGGNNPSTQNYFDYVSLVSKQKIIIGYGYKDPVDSLRKHTTCGGDQGINSGVWIYASLFALGDGNGNPHQDGVFTFEYQHPHPSTPATVIDGQLYDFNDLHSHIFPQTTDNPWPGALDYPWYNPLWPEANPYMERGYVHLYGSVYQQRAGFLHRSVGDPPNHDGTWNFTNHKYGAHSQGINYPGATGTGVGYKKDKHSDNRLKANTFPFDVNGNGIRLGVSSDTQTWNIVNYHLAEKVLAKTMQIMNEQPFLTINNHVYVPSIGMQEPISNHPEIRGQILKSYPAVSSAYLLTDLNLNPADSDTIQVVHFRLTNGIGISTVSFEVPVTGRLFDFLVNEEQQFMLAAMASDGSINFYKQNDESQYTLANTWDTGLDLLSPQQNRELSRMVLLPAANDSLYVLFYIRSADVDSLGTFYLAKGQMTFTGNHDNLAQPVSISLSAFPNPFTSEMKVYVNTSKTQKAKIEIFNLRGQLVKTLCASENLAEGEHTLSWDGTDHKGNTVSTGVYFLKAKIGNQSLTRKIVRIK